MSRFAWIAATLALTLFGQLMTKARALDHAREAGDRQVHYLLAMMTDPRYLAGLSAAFLASFCWLFAIKETALSVAYPFMALSFILVPLGSAWLFGDRLTMGQIIGGVLIAAGVTLNAVPR